MNKLAAFTLNMLGGSDYMWNVKHNQIHHSFTNVSGVDDDIDAGILLRLAPQQKLRWFHRIQHFYFWALYSILYLFWIFFSDYQKYFSNKIGDLSIGKLSVKDHVKFWFSKITHAFFFIILPVYMVGFTNWLIGFLTMTMSAGLVLSIVFQLAHTVVDADFPQTDDANKLPDEFAVHQLKTTANFATKSKWVSWYVGGLNFQIEHHLFPKVSHVHYPEISKIVKEVCKEYGVDYLEYKTVAEAVVAHVKFLKQMGSAKLATA
jgi:linoleoyl-CoA desaturase